MRKSDEIEKLIYQSIRDSKHFEDWEGILYSNLLEMILTKGGGIEEFIQHYGNHFYWMDMEWYFKKDFTQRYGEEGYQLLLDFVSGEDEDEL